MKDQIKILADKAAKVHDSGDAMRFAQAAQNLAQAACACRTAEIPLD